MNARLLFALAIVALLCVSFQPGADGGGTRAGPVGTKVPPGHISGDTTWNVGGSPYLVEGEVFIDPPVDLTLEPGTIVLFALGAKLTVDGRIFANGTILQRVTFNSALSQPSMGDWKGIQVSETGKASFSYSNVHYSKAGLNVTGGKATVSNSTFTFHTLSAVRAGKGANVSVKDSVISSCQYDGLMYDNGSKGAILRNEIRSCQYGTVTFSDVEIANNRFIENFIGIYSYNNTGSIMNNTITNSWDGLIVFYADPVITHNIIQGSLGNGTRFFFSNATFTDNRLEYNRIGLDIPYDSRGVLGNMSGNLVNGIDISDYYFYGVNGVRLSGLHFDSGWGAGYRDSQGGSSYMNGQGAFTFYDCHGVVVEDCLIENNWYGVSLAGSSATIINSTIRNTERSPGFLDRGSELTTKNVSYDGANYTIKDDISIVMEYEYVRAYVRNETYVPIEGAICNISENEVLSGTYFTDAEGYTPWVLAQDRVHTNLSGTFVNQVQIYVDYEGRAFDSNPRSFELPTKKTITFTDQGDVWAPVLTSFNVSGGAVKTNLTPVMTLRFSEEMNRTHVESATSLALGNTSIPLSFAWQGWNVTIVPQAPLEYSSAYSFLVTTGATDLKGNAMENPYAATITTQGPPPAITDETLMYIAIGAGVAVFVVILAIAFMFRKKGPKMG
jgi:parallel beta-helix repeat protein